MFGEGGGVLGVGDWFIFVVIGATYMYILFMVVCCHLSFPIAVFNLVHMARLSVLF